ncbi:MAG: RidA family protein [Acidimicrobiia bacterium]|nr:RidA family protein [Acidimicrobiia bacterium]
MQLLANPKGNYHFLSGIDPYSCGVVADAGHEVVHATLRTPLPWREGFERIDAHLAAAARGRHALCAIQLRSPEPFTMAGFIEFNVGYCDLVKSWDLYVGDLNPVARTNVAPEDFPPEAVSLHAFSYTVPAEPEAPRTFVVAGAGELRAAALDADTIVRRGEVGPDAMREKARHVVAIMEERLVGLGAGWDQVTTTDLYTVHLLEGLLEDAVLPTVGPAARHGMIWIPSRPPIREIEFEMDLRGVRTQITL